MCNLMQIAAIRKDIVDIQQLLQRRNILEVLTDSLKDCTLKSDGTCNDVRYKLIIDSSSDDSLVRMLFKYGVLDREKTKMYLCSDFPADRHMQVYTQYFYIRHNKFCVYSSILASTCLDTFA